MKLEKILDKLGSIEKNSFIKIIDSIISKNPKNYKEIEKILISSNKELKSVDNQNISTIFTLTEKEFSEHIKCEFEEITTQLDILIDILIRDGNCIVKQDWFSRLYENEIKKLKTKIKSLNFEFENEKSELSAERKRDYKIYKACLETAFKNDLQINREGKITSDELSILLTLSRELNLSQEEVKMINRLIVHAHKTEIDKIIESLKNYGIIFYSKRSSTIYVADEMVRILRKIRGKVIADKFFRRILKLLKEPQINLICKKHSIDRKLDNSEKMREIINRGISFTNIITQDLHKEGTTLTDKKKFLVELCDKGLNISPSLKGSTLEEKINNLIIHFEEVEKDEHVNISIDGYEKMLRELEESLPHLNSSLKTEFKLQEEKVLRSNFLLDHNIKPIDILDLISEKDLSEFCLAREIKSRGEKINNILEAYKDANNLFLENYENIGFRNFSALKENKIDIKESELGLKFEEITKRIFELLGFNVDEQLRKSLNTNIDMIDLIINLGNNEIILVECKTIKERGYNSFSSVTRQMNSYYKLAKLNNYKILKTLLVAPEFSDDFITECGMEYNLNLSLLTASSLLKILEGFKVSKHKILPYKLLMIDVLINEDRILKAIER